MNGIEKTSKKFSWRVVLIMLMLFGLPIGSYFYLVKGYQYRKQALDELKPKAQINWSDYSIDALGGDYEKPEESVVLVFSIKDQNDLNTKWDMFKKLQNQFGSQSVMKFLFVLPKDLQLPETDDMEMQKDLFVSYARDGFDQGVLHLVDQQQQIRGRYDPKNTQEIQKLVRHIAILLPLKKHAEAELIRKKEPKED